ncbi:type IV pilus biogenesis protein PilM [Kluyvera cryocrescens]|uniref:Type IV pilus biogenesis protein PilM n=1 Tax=Kluyvera cryocrescens TaxID=580 RepID=A0AAW9CBV8_KLUCR|nr:type IV pilus biogenesis protein PilM [Kluyvera cryocrescens]MDW3779656.1 type IV pilus biogenesis protein PilM [Kluyvera cryocrescens]MEB7558775.1 type IV pilus biogenesis protein PilM [Kluyvera cryocrescens]
MSRVILAVILFLFLIASDIDIQQRQKSTSLAQSQTANLYASQMLLLADMVNEYRHQTGVQDGVVPLDQLGLPFSPDSRIQYQLQQGRLWIWMPEQPGLIDALRSRSRGSALIGTLSGGQLIWLSGMATGLIAPQNVADGNVIYLN